MNFSLGVKEKPLHLSRHRALAGHLSGERSRCFDDPRPHHCSAASRQSPGILTTAWLHFVLLCKALHVLGWEVQAQDRVSSLPSSPAASLPPAPAILLLLFITILIQSAMPLVWFFLIVCLKGLQVAVGKAPAKRASRNLQQMDHSRAGGTPGSPPAVRPP